MTLQDEQEILKSETVTQKVIDFVTQKIVERFAPEKIIMFGSQARGEQGADSDLDLFIIKDDAQSDFDMGVNISRVFWGRRFPLDIIVRKPKEVALELARKNPFYYHIFKDGKLLYEHRS